jgi:1,4-alpha-glucan branching enzyme
MAGDSWQRKASLRLLLTYQYTYPGAKLLFMGGEFGQSREWSESRELDWSLLNDAGHAGIRLLVRDLNGLYRKEPSLHGHGYHNDGFEWIDCRDSPQSVISFVRQSHGETTVVVANFTPVPREHYRIGLPGGGIWREVLNSDSEYYGGSNLGNPYPLQAEQGRWMNRDWSVALTLPPLAALILRPAP